MARISTTLTSFNGGEVSPLLDARIDLDFYPNTCSSLLNFIPRPQGPITRRRGFKYVASAKSFVSGASSRATRLWPFVFAVGDAYVLEFGYQYIRFYSNQAQLMNGGVPLEIGTPYLDTDLPRLQFAQVGDLLYMVHPNYAPMVLSRVDLTPSFSLSAVKFINGPTLDENITNTTLQASATTGVPTITASDAIFNADMVGGVWAISEPSGSLGAYTQWEPSTAITAGTYVRNSSSVYQAASSGTTGTIAPVHKRGTVNDGGVNWTYVNNGTGYIKFETYISPTQFSGTVQLALPSTAVSAPTLFWNAGAWSGDQGWPQAITFYEQRAFYGGTAKQPQTIWASKSNGRFEDFDTGAANDDDSMVFTAATNEIDTIQWLESKTVLLAGTAGGVFVVKSSTFDVALTPSNVQIKKNTSTSCSNVSPELVNNTLFFSHRAGKKVLGAAYNFETDSFIAENFTIRAEHITQSGVVDMAYQQDPYSILWLVLGNGQLAGLTIDQNQKIAGWHRHQLMSYDAQGNVTSDNNLIENVVVIPTDTSDELWIVSNRTINGAVVRFIEVQDNIANNCYYVDSGVQLTGSTYSAGQLGGFSHLIGQQVEVLLTKSTSLTGNPAVTPNQTVNGSGEITLPYDCTQVIVGLPYNSDYTSHKLSVQIEDGMNLSKPTRIHKVITRLYETIGFQIGPNFNTLQTQPFRTTNDLMDNPPPARSLINLLPQDYEVDFNGTWDIGEPIIAIRQSQPYPLTLISLSVILNANTK